MIAVLVQEIHHSIYRNPVEFKEHAETCQTCIGYKDILAPDHERKCETYNNKRHEIVHSLEVGSKVRLSSRFSSGFHSGSVKNLPSPLQQDGPKAVGEVTCIYPKGRILVKCAGQLEYHDAANLQLETESTNPDGQDVSLLSSKEDKQHVVRLQHVAGAIETRAQTFFSFFEGKLATVSIEHHDSGQYSIKSGAAHDVDFRTEAMSISILCTPTNRECDSTMYTIKVERGAPAGVSKHDEPVDEDGTYLTGLAVSQGVLEPSFSPKHTDYHLYVDESSDLVSVTPTYEEIVDVEAFITGLLNFQKHSLRLKGRNRMKFDDDSEDGQALRFGWQRMYERFKPSKEAKKQTTAVVELIRMLSEQNPKGRDKQWQAQMRQRILVALDVNQDALLTMSEFKFKFLHANMPHETDIEYTVTRADLAVERLQGAPAGEIFKLYARFLCHSPAFNNFILGIVVVNCGVLASEYHGMSESTETLLWGLNFVCTIIFGAEFMIKIEGLGFKGYCADRFNIFDGCIVMLSLLELVLEQLGVQGGGISVFRALRVLRVFKVTASFDNLKRVIETIISTIPELGNFMILLMLFAFFFAVTGLHLFGGTFEKFEEHPRSHFDDFGASMMSVFQILTGENWNTVMYDAMHANGIAACFYFIALTVVGGYIMLNLFLAVLLVKTWDAFRPPVDPVDEMLRRSGKDEYEPTILSDDEKDEYVLQGKSLFCLAPDNGFRLGLQGLCRNKVFDNVLLVCIMISSASLAFEEPSQSQVILDVLKYMDLVFTFLFCAELALKVVTLNLIFGSDFAYLRNPWNVLDASVVAASIISITMADADIGWIKSFRVVRALRPLRVVKRIPELKQVVNSLFHAIPKLYNVLALLAMFWLIFGILGVQLFKGKFYACTDTNVIYELGCVGAGAVENDDGVIEISAPGWVPPPWSFDNLGDAVITLFEVSTLEMWLDIMYLCVDAVGVGTAPNFEQNRVVQLFFVAFIMFGSFFLLELFVSAIVSSYSQLQEESSGQAFQSERQKRLVAQMVFRSPEGPYVADYEWQQTLYDWTINPGNIMAQRFEQVVIACIILNMVVMAMYFDNMSSDFSDELDLYNNLFTALFAGETILKMLAVWPSKYFQGGWNRFDFLVVVITSIEFLADTLAPGKLDDIPGLTSLRVFRIAKICRLLAKFKGLTNLFLAVVQALPTIMNVGAILFLLFFVYAILGVNMFGYVKRGEFLTERANFESFGVALLTVFRMSTGESWNGIMADTRIRPPYCELDLDGVNNCGSSMAPLYFISFQLLGQFLMLNLFVAVMLEFYSRQQEGTEPFLSGEDYDTFEEKWVEFVGRDPRPPYLPYRLMPAELLDEFMLTLPDRIGWTKAELVMPDLRRQAYGQLHLPTRAMNVLVPWKRGLESTRPGYQSLEWEENKRAIEEDKIRAMQKGGGVTALPRSTSSAQGADTPESMTESGLEPDAVAVAMPESDVNEDDGSGSDGEQDSQGSSVSMMEHHYYQMDEVWHALYNRAEMRHLNDPENPDFKDDTSQSKAVKLFKDIMKTTGSDLNHTVEESIHVDSSVTIVPELTPRMIYSARVVQRFLRWKMLRFKAAQKAEIEGLRQQMLERREQARSASMLSSSPDALNRQASWPSNGAASPPASMASPAEMNTKSAPVVEPLRDLTRSTSSVSTSSAGVRRRKNANRKIGKSKSGRRHSIMDISHSDMEALRAGNLDIDDVASTLDRAPACRRSRSPRAQC